MSDTKPDKPLATLPGFAWIARNPGTTRNLATLLLAVILMAQAVTTWGAVVLAMAALAMVPVVFVVLLIITLGK